MGLFTLCYASGTHLGNSYNCNTQNSNGVSSFHQSVHAPLFAPKFITQFTTQKPTTSRQPWRPPPPPYGSLPMQIRPRYYTHRVEMVHTSYGNNDVFLIRLVLRRWPTYANTPKPTISPPPWPPPTPPTEHFPSSYGPATEPIESYSSLPYTSIIEIVFLRLVLFRRPSFAAARIPTILHRP